MWLLRGHASGNAGDLCRYARRYRMVLWQPGEAGCLDGLSASSCRQAMAALSNLAKFLGVYKRWKDVVENSGLKRSNGNNLQPTVVIDGVTWTQVSYWDFKDGLYPNGWGN